MKNKKIIIVSVVVILLLISIAIIFWPKSNKKTKEKAQRLYYILQDVTENKEGVIDKEGNVILNPEYDRIIIPDLSKEVFVVETDHEYKVLNRNKEEIMTNYKVEPIKGYTQEMINEYRGVLKYEKDNKYGLLSLDGKELTKPIYDEITTNNDDFNNYKVKQNSKYGLINDEGKVILDVDYSDVKSVNKTIWDNSGVGLGYEIAKVTDKGIKYGFANSEGTVLVAPKFEGIEKLEIPGQNYYIIVSENGKKGLFKDKTHILKTIYQEIAYTKKSIIVKKDGRYGLTSLDGKEIIAPRFTKYSSLDTLVSFEDSDNKYVYDENGKSISHGKYNIIETIANKNYIIAENYSGERVVISNNKTLSDKYIDLVYAFDDKFIFYKDGKYGVASIEKGTIIENKYDYINLIPQAKILEAIVGDETDVYSRELKKIESPKYSSIEVLSEDVAIIYNEEDIKYIDLDGKDIKLQDKMKLPAYSFKENGKYGFKTKDGTVVVEPIYEMVREFNELGFASIKEDGKWGSINTKFEIVQEPKYSFNNTNILPKLLGEYLINSENGLYAIYTHN